MVDGLDPKKFMDALSKGLSMPGSFADIKLNIATNFLSEEYSLHIDPLSVSVGKDIISNEEHTTSLRVGAGGLNGVRPELFHRTEDHIKVPKEDGEGFRHITNEFFDIGYLRAEISDPGRKATPYDDPLSDHQTNVSYLGGRAFQQHFARSEESLFSHTSLGVDLDGKAFAESTIAYAENKGEWDTTHAAQVSFSDDTPQLDIKFSTERYFNVPAIAGKFNTAVQGTLNPDRAFTTGATQIDLRPKDWKSADNWMARNISFSFNTKTKYEDGDMNNEVSMGVNTDLPHGARAGVKYNDNGDVSFGLIRPF